MGGRDEGRILEYAGWLSARALGAGLADGKETKGNLIDFIDIKERISFESEEKCLR